MIKKERGKEKEEGGRKGGGLYRGRGETEINEKMKKYIFSKKIKSSL